MREEIIKIFVISLKKLIIFKKKIEKLNFLLSQKLRKVILYIIHFI